MNRDALEEAVKLFLDALGADSAETQNTPRRVANMWIDHLTDGDRKNADDIIRRLSRTHCRETIVVRNIATHSVCPHHLLPYELTVDLAFVPDGFTAGFSRIAEFVEARAHRMVLLEELARDIADGLFTRLKAEGIAVRISSRHGCMVFQGSPRRESSVDAYAVRGHYQTDQNAAAQVQRLLLASR